MVGAACSSSSSSSSSSSDEDAAAPRQLTYVAIGASESVGVGADRPTEQAWTAVFHRTALPPRSRFVNLGVSGSTVVQALTAQMPKAVAERPDLVTVWLNVNDIVRLVSVGDYEGSLGVLVRGLRGGGRTQVLVANTPPIEELPVVRACLPKPPPGRRCPLPVSLPGPEPVIALVDQYNAAIARVVDQNGAVLVDLHRAGTRARSSGDYAALVAEDGFHPSTAGHRAVAEVFKTAARAAPAVRDLIQG